MYMVRFLCDVLVFDSACPVSGWSMLLINRFAVRFRFPISIYICTYGYLGVFSSSLETDILTFTFNFFSSIYVTSALAYNEFVFVLRITTEIVFLDE